MDKDAIPIIHAIGRWGLMVGSKIVSISNMTARGVNYHSSLSEESQNDERGLLGKKSLKGVWPRRLVSMLGAERGDGGPPKLNPKSSVFN